MYDTGISCRKALGWRAAEVGQEEEDRFPQFIRILSWLNYLAA